MKRFLALFSLLFCIAAIAGSLLWKSAPVPSAGEWAPNTPDGEAVLWLDPTVNENLTIEASEVAVYASRVGGWTYSNASDRPELGTINGVQAISTAGGKRLLKDQDVSMLAPTDKFLIGMVLQQTSVGAFNGIFWDGSSSIGPLSIGRSNLGGWQQTFFTANGDRFAPVAFNTASPPTGDVELLILTYDGANNDVTGWTAHRNGVSVNVDTSSTITALLTPGGILDFGAGYYFVGLLGDVVIIKNYTSNDLTQLTAYENAKYSIF